MIHNMELCPSETNALIDTVVSVVGDADTSGCNPGCGPSPEAEEYIGRVLGEPCPDGFTEDDYRRVVLRAAVACFNAFRGTFDPEAACDMEWFINRASSLLHLRGELIVSQLVLEDGRAVLGVSYAEI